MKYEQELKTAIQAVTDAGNLCRMIRRDFHSDYVTDKEDKSPVTVADYCSQAIISHELSRQFPEDKIVGEESLDEFSESDNLTPRIVNYLKTYEDEFTAQKFIESIGRCNHAGGRGRFWTVDPIDGTKGFLRNDQYAVALALIEDGEVVLGILGCPNLLQQWQDKNSPAGCVFWAVKEQGAHQVNWESEKSTKIIADKLDNPSEAVFCQSYEKKHTSKSDAGRIKEILGITKNPVELDSQVKYGAVARGDASIYLRLPKREADGDIIRYEEKIWDHAAGMIIIEEAGGRVTDIRGDRLDFTQGKTLKNNLGVIATNGKLHEQALSASAEVYGL